MSASKEPYVVLVTGGNGFLGQHIVGLLQTKADHVTEIRVLDVVPYRNKLDYEARKPVKDYVGSIVNLDLVRKACRGVQCVMHIASIVDTRLLPEYDLSYRINVQGTDNLLQACREHKVPRLLYCSSVEVVNGYDGIVNGNEDEISFPEISLFDVYGPTKRQAEINVLMANDDTLQTAALRPTVMYGELDERYIGKHYLVGKQLGAYVHFTCQNGETEHSYVGNVAWAFICAERALYNNTSGCADITGNAYFVCDDSPRTSMFNFLSPILQESGLKPSPVAIPRWLVIFTLHILYYILSLVNLVYKVNLSYGPAPFYFMGRTFTFSYAKASRLFGYKPLYTYEESKNRTVSFLKTLDKTKCQ